MEVVAPGEKNETFNTYKSSYMFRQPDAILMDLL